MLYHFKKAFYFDMATIGLDRLDIHIWAGSPDPSKDLLLENTHIDFADSHSSLVGQTCVRLTYRALSP